MNLFNITVSCCIIFRQFEYYVKYGQSNAMLADPSPCNFAVTALWAAYNFCSIRCLFVRTDCQNYPSEEREIGSEDANLMGCKPEVANWLSNFFSETQDDLVISITRRSLVIFKHLTFQLNFVLAFTSFLLLLYMRISFPQCNFSLCAELHVSLYPLLSPLSFVRHEERLSETGL